MTSHPTRLSVALAAPPWLLADSLRSLLPSDVEVTVVLDDVPPGRFDVALVSRDSQPVDADVVILLDETPTSRGGGSVRSRVSKCGRDLADIDEVIDYVAGLRGDEPIVEPR